MNSIPIIASSDIFEEALDKVTYGSELNKQFVKAAEAGNTGAMIASLVDGANIDEPKDINSGSLALFRAEKHGHKETASVLRAYLEHRQSNKQSL